jgi:MFS transporter, DHA1 family, multidrug resistance protein
LVSGRYNGVPFNLQAAMLRSDSRVIAILLTALVAFGPLSTDLYLPSLPTLVRVFGTDIATVQLTLSVFLVGFAVSQLAYGPLSDRFGRRPVLIGGVTVFVLASAACMLAQSIEQLITARFLQALGSCCGPVLGRAVVRDVYGRERAATVLAYMAMAMAVAPAVGPLLGGFLTSLFGWRANFLFLVGFGVLILAAVWFLLDETNRHRDELALHPRRLAGNYALLLRSRTWLGFTVCIAATYSAMFAFISGSSFVLIGHFGLSPELFGLSFGTIVLGYMVGSFTAGRLSHRLGIDRMVRLGSTLAGGGRAGRGRPGAWPHRPYRRHPGADVQLHDRGRPDDAQCAGGSAWAVRHDGGRRVRPDGLFSDGAGGGRRHRGRPAGGWHAISHDGDDLPRGIGRRGRLLAADLPASLTFAWLRQSRRWQSTGAFG